MMAFDMEYDALINRTQHSRLCTGIPNIMFPARVDEAKTMQLVFPSLVLVHAARRRFEYSG
jgi:hypothetical protein